VPTGESGPVVRVVEGGEQPGSQEIAADLVAGDVLSFYRAASILNDCDVAIVQHEYGVYGGPDGDEVLTLLDALTVPTVVVLHTVLSRPTAHQRTVLERVAGFADSVVTMTSTARDRLVDGYVPHQDPTAIANALRTVLTRRTAPAARPDGSVAELWPAVADRYRQLADRLIRVRVAV
jgi:hypothetical protein